MRSERARQYSGGFRRPPMGAVLAIAAVVEPALAQLDFSTPGSLAAPPEDRRAVLERGLEESRFKLGRVRLDPWWGLEDASIVDDRREHDGADATAAVGAGVHAYVPMGSSVVVSAYALPHVVWWREQADRRRLDGRYGAGMFGYWNRLSLEVYGRRDEAQDLASPESDRLAHTRRDESTVSSQVDIGGHLAVYGTARTLRIRTLESGEASDLHALDRDEWIGQGGVRLLARGTLALSLGLERSQVTFEECDGRCEAVHRAVVAGAGYRSSRARVWLDLARRYLEDEGEHHTVLAGRALVVLRPERRVSWHVYGSQDPYYTLEPGSSFLLQRRLGAAVEVRLGWRTSARLFAESGANEYLAAGGGTTGRDGVRSAGLRLGIPVGGGARLQAQWSRSSYSSDDPGRDRTDDLVRIGIALGSGPGGW